VLYTIHTSRRSNVYGFVSRKRSARTTYAYKIVFFRYFALLLAAIALPTEAPRAVSRAEFDKLMSEVSNWERWGKGDELGAMNLFTPQKRKAAAQLVTEGVPISLFHDAEKQSAPDNPRPFVHEMVAHGATPDTAAEESRLS
jgi:hypothetical protein